LDWEIGQGDRNLARLPPDRLPGVVAVVRGLEEEREKARGELTRLGKRAADVEGPLKAAEKHLGGLREALLSDNPEEVRAALHELLEKVELSFTQQLVKGRKRSQFKEGVAHLKVDLQSFHWVTSAP
jgi:hypothetical protein